MSSKLALLLLPVVLASNGWAESRTLVIPVVVQTVSTTQPFLLKGDWTCNHILVGGEKRMLCELKSNPCPTKEPRHE